MVRASEMSGSFGHMLDRIAGHLDQQVETSRMIKSAMIYPALLLTFGLAAVAFLVTFAVPVLAETFREMGGALPWSTRSLMAMSDFLRAQWLPIAVAAGVLVLALRQALHTDAGRRQRRSGISTTGKGNTTTVSLEQPSREARLRICLFPFFSRSPWCTG